MNLYQKLVIIFLLIEEQLSMLQFFKSRTYTFHPQIVIKTFEGNGKNLSIVIKTFERTGKSLPPSIISKEDERSMSQGRISEGDKPPVQQERHMISVHLANLSFMSNALCCEFCEKILILTINLERHMKTVHLP